MKKSKIVSVLIGAALFLAVALPVVFLESVIGGVIMKLFGFRYDSMRSVFLFFMVAAVADFGKSTSESDDESWVDPKIRKLRFVVCAGYVV